MVAMVVMVGGVMAIVRMQQEATRANRVGRELGTSLQIAQNALERLRLDTVTWTNVDVGADDAVGVPANLLAADVLGGTLWLYRIGNGAVGWQTMQLPQTGNAAAPAGSDMTASPGLDFYGLDQPTVADINANAHYCVQMNLRWVQRGRTIHSEVRVFSRRDRTGSAALTTTAPACVLPGGVAANNLRFVHLQTVLRVNSPNF